MHRNTNGHLVALTRPFPFLPSGYRTANMARELSAFRRALSETSAMGRDQKSHFRHFTRGFAEVLLDPQTHRTFTVLGEWRPGQARLAWGGAARGVVGGGGGGGGVAPQ